MRGKETVRVVLQVWFPRPHSIPSPLPPSAHQSWTLFMLSQKAHCLLCPQPPPSFTSPGYHVCVLLCKAANAI